MGSKYKKRQYAGNHRVSRGEKEEKNAPCLTFLRKLSSTFWGTRDEIKKMAKFVRYQFGYYSGDVNRFGKNLSISVDHKNREILIEIFHKFENRAG